MEENKMFPSTRLIIKMIPFRVIVLTLMVIVLILFPLLASAGEDPCSETGIFIMNRTGRNVWYTRNGGPCTIWVFGHILVIKPEDTLIIYRDMTCSTEYCSNNLTYDACKFLDVDRNCRVRIIPRCTFSDM